MKAIWPWGTAPTPLLPKALMLYLGHVAAPPSLSNALGLKTLADLEDRIWDQTDAVPLAWLREIMDVVRPHVPSLQHVVIRAGQPLQKPLRELPFSSQIYNRVLRYQDWLTAEHLTLGDILAVPSFGPRAALEFACILEAAFIDPEAQDDETFNTVTKSPANSTLADAGSPDIMAFFQALGAFAFGEKVVDTLGEVLPDPLDDWPYELQQLWRQVGIVRSGDIAGEVLSRYSVPGLMAGFISQMNDVRFRQILAERVLVTGNPSTLATLGLRYGISRERVRQLERTIRTTLTCFKDTQYQPVCRRAQALRERIGVGIPINHPVLAEALQWVTRDYDDGIGIEKTLAQQLFLWLAGPYIERKGWMVAVRQLPQLSIDALKASQDERGVISNHAAQEILEQLGLKPLHHNAWIEDLNVFRRVHEGYIYFKGSIPDKAYTLLRYYARPLTADFIAEEIGSGNVQSVRNRLVADAKFWLINIQREFVIAGTPGYYKYTSIVDAICREIDTCGGQASWHYLVEKITSIHGVKAASVVVCINSPKFAKDDEGIVRIRGANEPLHVSTNIAKAARCYKTHAGVWCWRLYVDEDVIRGSGRKIPGAFARILGCDIGKKIEVSSEYGPITVSWPLASSFGAAIGSLRSIAACYEAEIGDYLFIKATEPQMTFSCLDQNTLRATDSAARQLNLLVGYHAVESDAEAWVNIARALDITAVAGNDVRLAAWSVLQARGENTLADMIELPSLSQEDYLARIGQLLGS